MVYNQWEIFRIRFIGGDALWIFMVAYADSIPMRVRLNLIRISFSGSIGMFYPCFQKCKDKMFENGSRHECTGYIWDNLYSIAPMISVLLTNYNSWVHPHLLLIPSCSRLLFASHRSVNAAALQLNSRQTVYVYRVVDR